MVCLPRLIAAQNDETDKDICLKADAFYLKAVGQRMAGNHARAYQLYRHTLDIIPEHVGANYDMSTYYHILGNDSLAGKALRQAADNDPENYWVKQALVQLYVSEDRHDDAIAQLEQMAKVYPNNSSVLLMLEELYQKKEDYNKVIETLERIELLEGKSEEISTEKFRVYKMMNDDERALKEMNELAEEYPNDLRYRALIANVYIDSHEYDKALEILLKIREDEPNNVYALMSLATLYEQTRQFDKYNEILGDIVANEGVPDEFKMQIMQSIAVQSLYGQQGNDTTRVMNLFDKVLSTPQKDTSMAELCVRYMVSSQIDKEKIKPVLYLILEIDPEEDMARNQLLSYNIEEDNDEEVIRLCKTAVDYSSKNILYYYYLGVAYLKNDEYEKAIEANRKGLDKVDDKTNIDIVYNMYAIIGDSYHALGNNRMAFEAYDSCLLIKPDDPLVLNNYAYYLALEKKQLDKALEMSAKAIETETDNPTYLDTYAWVLFRLGRYDEAKQVIDKVIKGLGEQTANDATLVEHAGDIYFKCGDRNAAIEFWKKAATLANPSKSLEKKIKKRKFVE